MDLRFLGSPATAPSLNFPTHRSSVSNSKQARSLPFLSPRAFTTSRANDADPGRDAVLEVETLNSWNLLSEQELQKRQQNEEYMDHYRSQFADFENLVLQRKAKYGMGAALRQSEFQLKHSMEISKRRAEKQNLDQALKEHTKFSKRHEEDLAARAAELQAAFEEVTAQREVLRRKNTTLREQLTEAEITIKAVRVSSSRQETVLKGKMKSLRSEDLSYVFSKRSACQLELVTKEREFQELVLSLNQEVEDNSARTRDLDNQAKDIRSRIRALHSQQIDHYRKILRDGLDTRSEGLAWVVKALWKLGEKVQVNMFPAFLDLTSIHVILFLAQKGLELEELTEYMAQMQATTRQSLTSCRSPSRVSDLSERMAVLKRPIKTQRPVLDSGKMVFAVENPALLSQSDSTLANLQTSQIEERISSLKSLVQMTQEQELRRIAKDCFMNGLEQRVKRQARELLAAVAGAEALSRQMAVIVKEQKELADDLRKTKTFSFTPAAK